MLLKSPIISCLVHHSFCVKHLSLPRFLHSFTLNPSVACARIETASVSFSNMCCCDCCQGSTGGEIAMPGLGYFVSIFGTWCFFAGLRLLRPRFAVGVGSTFAATTYNLADPLFIVGMVCLGLAMLYMLWATCTFGIRGGCRSATYFTETWCLCCCAFCWGDFSCRHCRRRNCDCTLPDHYDHCAGCRKLCSHIC